MPDNSIEDRREDFEFAYGISFGEMAKRLAVRAHQLFSDAGVASELIAAAQSEIHDKSIALIKSEFPEFADEVDARLKREIQ
jgi:hypothetical protein